ncbi:MAG: Cyclic pyranopterin monophosphate synthase accessory protein [Alphaproteobacteria bacterium MarineAlpha5_Bin9]|nr:MAG: Cyclic pyranopterin monophosphate synthase accessory protein [Alphaproteobacteria bacterium MarineAlpha5_Bin9]|tara:strand:+ start:7547 stop:8014 length:468 start_codon:yes stop_codon:yes gene_type:complete
MISHLNKKNNPNYVDISKKTKSHRFAKAKGLVVFSKKTFSEIKNLKTKKGSIINIASIAAIIGVKKTTEIIPLTHPISIDNIDIDIKLDKENKTIIVICSVKSFAKTGVEMEALSGVSAACLTIYDMCKAIDKKIKIRNIQLLEKKGGKSDFFNK